MIETYWLPQLLWWINSPRWAGHWSLALLVEALRDSGIEARLLIGAQHRAHDKDVLERRLLKVAHRPMGRIHRCANTRAVLMLGCDCGGEPRVVGLEPCFERSATDSEIALQYRQPRFLRDIKIEIIVHEGVAFGAAVMVRAILAAIRRLRSPPLCA